jgi:GAG-pre-integrase domain
VGNLDEKGFHVSFGGGKCEITDPNGIIVGKVPKNDRGLYRVEHHSETADAAAEELTLDQFHRRMGHISPESARRLVRDHLVTGVFLDLTGPVKPFFCESCIYAKSSRKPISKVREGERATVFGGEVHTDLWGPAPVESKGGKKYYITFTDDKTRLTHLYLLRKKDEAFETYKQYEAWVDTQLSAKIKILHSD